MASSFKLLNHVSSSDIIWRRLFRVRWPQLQPCSILQNYGTKEAYLSTHTDFNKFKFLDPLVADLFTGSEPFTLMHLDRNTVYFHSFFPLHETSFFRSELKINENMLVTSSCDHSIRLWWKGCSQRCFTGHNGPVFALSDKLLGDGATKVFASGGEDCTVRLWSLSSRGKRGQHASKKTLFGHEKSVVLTSVAGHNTSLLVSMSKDSKESCRRVSSSLLVC